jgi:hypothetical protein
MAKLESKQEEAAWLARECEELREAALRNTSLNTSQAAGEQDDGRSEAMSNSTVSKVEELNRMKDVEDSFEDRYSKLKLIAIKLKKKCGEQAKQLQELEGRKVRGAEEGGEPGNGQKDKVASLTRNFTQLQGQYDSVVDRLETSEAAGRQQGRDLEAALAESLATKQRAEEAGQQLLSARTELALMEGRVRDGEAELRSVQVTAEGERRERVAQEGRAREQEDAASVLRERAGASFLLEETVASLRLQAGQLEGGLAGERDRADRAQQLLSSTRAQLAQAEADLARSRSEGEEAGKKWQEAARTGEAAREQLAELTQEWERQNGGERARAQQLERQVAALEASGAATARQLQEREVEVERLAREYENYKLRAQSVLKQSKDQQVELEASKKQEEIFAMEKLNDALNDKLKSLSLEVTVCCGRQ